MPNKLTFSYLLCSCECLRRLDDGDLDELGAQLLDDGVVQVRAVESHGQRLDGRDHLYHGRPRSPCSNAIIKI